MTYHNHRTFSDRFLGVAKAVIGVTEVQIASDHLDRQLATDLVVCCPYEKRQTHYAFRVRKHEYLDQYGSEFTVRCRSLSGCDTEFQKIMQGKGDRMLYAFCNKRQTGFAKWSVIDLALFRNWAGQELENGCQFKPRNNTDGTKFYAFSLDDLPSEIVVASGDFFELNQVGINDEPAFCVGTALDFIYPNGV
jgi:hypothetical protein